MPDGSSLLSAAVELTIRTLWIWHCLVWWTAHSTRSLSCHAKWTHAFLHLATRLQWFAIRDPSPRSVGSCVLSRLKGLRAGQICLPALCNVTVKIQGLQFSAFCLRHLSSHSSQHKYFSPSPNLTHLHSASPVHISTLPNPHFFTPRANDGGGDNSVLPP
ncbi:hypothetical protein B0O80DRAFT_259433 [Mortierella sp. GBAus27b]|nr:hypothetical protein B0O80DRAFT_259433 [Mortierella sp. GBAus27b]